MNYGIHLEKVFNDVGREPSKGEVAKYIPELAKISGDKFGVHISCVDGSKHSFGNASEKFSIQSISKVLSLLRAYQLAGEKLWNRVGVEPSGTAFNSLVQLETDLGIPRNPLINAGALVVSDVLISNLENPKQEFIQFVRDLAGIPNLNYNEKVAQSEALCGYRNAALVNLIKDFGNINNEVEEVLDFYFHLCSIEMSCVEMAETFLLFAQDGICPMNDKQVIKLENTKRINAIMQTCGFYDEAGEFAFKVGLPGKSGVGGVIVAILPDQYSIAVWSPCLNEKGNSYKGMKLLEEFTTATGYSLF
ncbi:MAG: glutaminase [Crocinitomicaceae bacterium]|nr:glutaminase [Crocinitomicaceae bacterium]